MGATNLKPSFYLFIQKRLIEKAGRNKILDFKEASIHVSYVKLPKKLVPVVMKELENLGLIERVDRYKVRIINCHLCKWIDRFNIFQHRTGLW